MLLNFPGFSFVRVISRAKAFFNTLLTSELFPEPDTPVTATKRPVAHPHRYHVNCFPQRLLNGSNPYLPCGVRWDWNVFFTG